MVVDVVAETVIVHRNPSGEAYLTVDEHRDGVLWPRAVAPPLAFDALFDRPSPR